MKDFEERLARLEEIGEKLKDGTIDLDSAGTLFHEGMKLAKKLEAELRKMEQRIEILINEPDEPDEKPILELFPELSSDAE